MKKILIVILDNVGDTVIATSTLKPIKTTFPNAVIGFWTKKYASVTLENHPLIDHLYASDPFWDKSPGQKSGSFRLFLNVWNQIRKDRYDVAILLNAEWRRAGLIHLMAIPQRIGFRRRKSGPFLTKSINPIPHIPVMSQHRLLIDSFWDINKDNQNWYPFLEPTAEAENNFQAWRKEIGFVDNPFVVLHTFGGSPEKCWPLERWAELQTNLQTANPNIRFVIIGAPSEEKMIREFWRTTNRPPLPFLNQGMAFAMAAIKNAVLFIGTDSGPGHIAAALGTPVVSLFGPTNPNLYRPHGPSSVSVIKKNQMTDISVNEVSEAAQIFLTQHVQKSIIG